MNTPSSPKLSEMLNALSKLPTGPAAPPPVPTTEALQVESTVSTGPETEMAVFEQFRRDMRAAGLAAYDTVHDVLGVPHDGPAVNVRDPAQATRATKLTLASLALAPGLWRMYPVFVPITL